MAAYGATLSPKQVRAKVCNPTGLRQLAETRLNVSSRPIALARRDDDRTALSEPEADMLTIERLLVDPERGLADHGYAGSSDWLVQLDLSSSKLGLCGRCRHGNLKVERIPRVLLWDFGLDGVEQT